jgi:hypothetical protein
VVRIGAFIPKPTAGELAYRSAGDKRGFDPRFTANRSRATFRIDFARRIVTVEVSPSCSPDHKRCDDAMKIKEDDSPFDRHNQVQVQPEGDGGVKISYALVNSHGGDFPIVGHISPASIDGDVHLRPSTNHRGFTIEETADDFPAREAYYYDGGPPETLYQNEPGFLGFVGLFPGPQGS